MIVELTGLDVANASLLDESSAAAEALAMAFAVNDKRNKFFISENLFPQTIDCMRTRAKATGTEVTVGDVSEFPWDQAEEYAGVIV